MKPSEFFWGSDRFWLLWYNGQPEETKRSHQLLTFRWVEKWINSTYVPIRSAARPGKSCTKSVQLKRGVNFVTKNWTAWIVKQQQNSYFILKYRHFVLRGEEKHLANRFTSCTLTLGCSFTCLGSFCTLPRETSRRILVERGVVKSRLLIGWSENGRRSPKLPDCLTEM